MMWYTNWVACLMLKCKIMLRKEIERNEKMTTEWLRFIDYKWEEGKWKKVIVDIVGDIINENPTEEEIKGLIKYPDIKSKDIKRLSEKEMKEYLLEFLRYFYYIEGRIPLTVDFNGNPKYPNYTIYYNTFGSWNNAIRDADFIPTKFLNNEELLRYLIQFYEENGRSPTEKDFIYAPKYPSVKSYMNRFGTWQKGLKIIGLDIDSMVNYRIIETNDQKGRLGEIIVRDHFLEKDKVIDLAGENPSLHIYDGIDPDGNCYDVKTHGLDNYGRWIFPLRNVDIDQIDYFYLIAFNKDYTKLLNVENS